MHLQATFFHLAPPGFLKDGSIRVYITHVLCFMVGHVRSDTKIIITSRYFRTVQSSCRLQLVWLSSVILLHTTAAHCKENCQIYIHILWIVCDFVDIVSEDACLLSGKLAPDCFVCMTSIIKTPSCVSFSPLWSMALLTDNYFMLELHDCVCCS